MSEPPAPRPARGPRIVELLLMLLVPVLLFLVDVDSVHQAGAPRGPLGRARAALARRLRRPSRPRPDA